MRQHRKVENNRPIKFYTKLHKKTKKIAEIKVMCILESLLWQQKVKIVISSGWKWVMPSQLIIILRWLLVKMGKRDRCLWIPQQKNPLIWATILMIQGSGILDKHLIKTKRKNNRLRGNGSIPSKHQCHRVKIFLVRLVIMDSLLWKYNLKETETNHQWTHPIWIWKMY